MKKHRKQGYVKVLVNGKYRVIGKLLKVENDIATVRVETHYGKGFIDVESHVKDLWEVKYDIGDFKDCGKK